MAAPCKVRGKQNFVNEMKNESTCKVVKWAASDSSFILPERWAQLERLMILGRLFSVAAAFLIRGSSKSVKRKWPKWLVPNVISKPSSVLGVEVGTHITPVATKGKY